MAASQEHRLEAVAPHRGTSTTPPTDTAGASSRPAYARCVSVRRFVPEDWVEAEDVGGGVRLLHRAEGPPRVEHTCGRWPDEQEPDGQLVTVVAPHLKDGGHTWERDAEGRTTVNPSILCQSCGLHGFVRQGAWSTA